MEKVQQYWVLKVKFQQQITTMPTKALTVEGIPYVKDNQAEITIQGEI